VLQTPVAANCVAQGIQLGGTQNPGLRLSWSSREHRQSHHPTPYYGMRKAKFRRIARTGILLICDELTQPPSCSCVSITLPSASTITTQRFEAPPRVDRWSSYSCYDFFP